MRNLADLDAHVVERDAHLHIPDRRPGLHRYPRSVCTFVRAWQASRHGRPRILPAAAAAHDRRSIGHRNVDVSNDSLAVVLGFLQSDLQPI